MARCKHIRINITEYGEAHTDHSFENGEWTHHTDFGRYTGELYVKCFDCEFSKNFLPSRVPKWLKARLKDAIKIL